MGGWCAKVRDSACRAARRDGQRCRSTVVLPSGFCAMHDPARQAEVAAARARGGKQKATSARLGQLVPASLKPTLGLLLTAIEEAYEGSLPPARASAMASLAGAIVRLYTAGTLEERLQALEQAHADSRSGT